MARSRKPRPTTSAQPTTLHKPKGFFHDRVQRAGPQHFGLACFDCHKDYSQWLLADFFGNILLPPQRLQHLRQPLRQALALLRHAVQQHDLRDFIAVVERTGSYHRPVQRALLAHDIEVRIVHPFATKQFRQVAHPGDKTDDHDLMALHRAALNGFALIEHERDEFWTSFLRVGRFRRTLIHAVAKLRTRSHHLLDAYLPGFIDHAFPDFWNNNCAWPIAAAVLSPQEIMKMGEDGLTRLLRDQGIRFHRRSLAGILTWAAAAPAPDVAPENARRLALALQRERAQKTLEIRALDIDLAQLLCRTPYVLMLSCPGLNVATVADIAAELGPIHHYASAKGLTGRAGLWPTRHQSGQVDRRGRLVRCANRKLRAALLRGADSLLRSNPHFLNLGTVWKKAGEDPHRRVVKVANHLCRILYQMVAGQQVFAHPQCQERHLILDKLITFHAEHDSDAQVTERDLDAAVSRLPASAWAAEAEPLRERLEALQRRRGKDLQGLAATLPKVLARMGVSKVESKESGGRATADRKG